MTRCNAAGTPLLVASTIANGLTCIDESAIAPGIGGWLPSAPELEELSTADRQTLMNRLRAKYDGVQVDDGTGPRPINLPFEMLSADAALYQGLLIFGATALEHSSR